MNVLLFAVGCSMDPNAITMVDSVKVYVKTKEAFGWPEEPDDFPEPAATSTSKLVNTSNGVAVAEADSTPAAPLPMTVADRCVLCAVIKLPYCRLLAVSPYYRIRLCPHGTFTIYD